MTNLKSICQEYHKLVDHNNKALDAQVGLRDKFEDNESLVDAFEQSYSLVFSEIKGMADSYVKMGNTREAKGLYKKIAELEQKSRHTIIRAKLIKNKCDSRPELMKRVSDELYKNVECLSPHMESPSDPNFKSASCETPHDLIRYFHQKGIESIFSQGKKYMSGGFRGDAGSGMRKANLRGVNFNVIDLDDAIVKTGKSDFKRKDVECIPLCAAIDFCCTPLPGKNGNRGQSMGAGGYGTFQVIASKDRIHMPWRLGCHYSELDAMISEEVDSNSIKLHYKDNSASGGPLQRMKYIKSVLTDFGFNTTISGATLHAEFESDDPKGTYDTFRETMRLLRSTKNLDLGGHLGSQSAINKAKEAFHKGTTDLQYYLGGGRY